MGPPHRAGRGPGGHGGGDDRAGGDLAAVEWDPIERAALAAVDETADEGAVADDTWSTLAAHLDSGDLIELLMLIGHYMMLSTVLRSLRVALEPSMVTLADGIEGGPGR